MGAVIGVLVGAFVAGVAIWCFRRGRKMSKREIEKDQLDRRGVEAPRPRLYVSCFVPPID